MRLLAASLTTMASEPTRPDLTTWPHYELYRRVRDALAAVPTQFATEIFISGVLATDLHTLNSALGAAIEEQVVATLNAMRATWDPDDDYALFSFVRQPQTFPDVLLRVRRGQTLRYMSYVQDELAEDGQTVHGVIIAHEDDQRIRRALTMTPNIVFYRYQVSFKLVKA